MPLTSHAQKYRCRKLTTGEKKNKTRNVLNAEKFYLNGQFIDTQKRMFKSLNINLLNIYGVLVYTTTVGRGRKGWIHQSQRKPREPEIRGRPMYISTYDLRQSLASGPPF